MGIDVTSLFPAVARVFDAPLLGLHFGNHNFKNHRLTFRDQLPLIAWQLGEQFQKKCPNLKERMT